MMWLGHLDGLTLYYGVPWEIGMDGWVVDRIWRERGRGKEEGKEGGKEQRIDGQIDDRQINRQTDKYLPVL